MVKTGKFKIEYNKLKRCFKDLDENKLNTIEPMIEAAAFAYSQMQALMVQIEAEGSVTLFEQGVQKYHRVNPACGIYSTYHSQYMQVLKELIKLLPEKTEAANKLDQFINAGKSLKVVR